MLRAWAESCAHARLTGAHSLSLVNVEGGEGVCAVHPPDGRTGLLGWRVRADPAHAAPGSLPDVADGAPWCGMGGALRGEHRRSAATTAAAEATGLGREAGQPPRLSGWGAPPPRNCQPSPRGRFPTDVAPVGRATHHARPRGDGPGAYAAWVATHRSRAPASAAPLSVRTYRDVRGSLRLSVFPFSLSSSLRRSWPHVPAPTRAAHSFVYTVPVQYCTNKQLHRFSSYAPARFTRIAVGPPLGAATDRGYPRTRVPAARRVVAVAQVSGVRGRPPCSPLPSICAPSAARTAAQARNSPEPLWR